jgi:hypothetical protein
VRKNTSNPAAAATRSEEKVPLGAFVPLELHRRVAALAAANDESISRIVRRAVTRELDRTSKEAA